ncbi:hypothetical protein HanIR_Chr16g0816301 [Helianthus annuus]|nr:hypothetical protein HanIR_Chr16g0816301 [Helianthus annuus]
MFYLSSSSRLLSASFVPYPPLHLPLNAPSQPASSPSCLSNSSSAQVDSSR